MDSNPSFGSFEGGGRMGSKADVSLSPSSRRITPRAGFLEGPVPASAQPHLDALSRTAGPVEKNPARLPGQQRHRLFAMCFACWRAAVGWRTHFDCMSRAINAIHSSPVLCVCVSGGSWEDRSAVGQRSNATHETSRDNATRATLPRLQPFHSLDMGVSGSYI